MIKVKHDIEEVLIQFVETTDDDEAKNLLGVIYEHFYSFVYSKVLTTTDSLESYDIKDIINEVFLKLYLNRKRLKSNHIKVMFKWLGRVGATVTIDFLRKSQKNTKIQTEELVDLEVTHIQESTLIWSLEVYDFLIDCIKLLNIFKRGSKQELVYLHYIRNIDKPSHKRYQGSGFEQEKYRGSFNAALEKTKKAHEKLYACVEEKLWNNG